MSKPHYPLPAPIEAYGNGGFRFAGMSHRGSILCLPSGVHGWDVTAGMAMTPEVFGPVFAEGGVLSFLLFGCGRAMAAPPLSVKKAFIEARVGLEVMDTGAACRTYNVLLAEGRPVAAALVAVD